MRTARRRFASGVLATLVLVGVTGCAEGEEKESLTITGDCSLSESKLPITRLVPEKLIRSLVGPGSYDTDAGLVVRDGRLPAAYDGNCTLVGEDGDVLRLATLNRKAQDYAEAQQMLAAGNAPGLVKVDDSTYVLPEDGGGAKAVAILPQRLVILRLLAPAKGVDAEQEVGRAIGDVITRIQEISGR